MLRDIRTRRRFTAAGGALASAVAVSLGLIPVAGATPTAPNSCEIRALPVKEGTDAGTVSGSGPGGSPLLGVSYGFGDQGLVSSIAQWEGGELTNIDVPGGAGAVEDMNADGVIVGNREKAPGEPELYTHDGGELTPLPGDGEVSAINDEGRMVGYRNKPTDNGPPIAVPVTWQGPGAEPVDLEVPSDNIGHANDIANDGTIVGEFDRNGFIWGPDGTPEQLPRPEGVPADTAVAATAIAGPWVLGTAGEQTVRWNLDAGTAEVIEGVVEPGSINENGWIVGETAEQKGVLFAEGSLLELPELEADWMHRPASISADGTSIGGMAQARGNPSPVTENPVEWTCSTAG